MGLLTSLLTLPVTGPIRGAAWVMQQVHEAAEAEFYDPGHIKRALVALERRLEAGEIDEDQFETEEAVLLDRLEQAGRRG